MMYNGGGYAPMMMQGSQMVGPSAHLAPCDTEQLEFNAAELRARAAALENMAKDCMAAATECKSRGSGSPSGSPSNWSQPTPQYIPGQQWSAMQQPQINWAMQQNLQFPTGAMHAPPGMSASRAQSSPVCSPAGWSEAGWHSSHVNAPPSWHSSSQKPASSPSSRSTKTQWQKQPQKQVAEAPQNCTAPKAQPVSEEVIPQAAWTTVMLRNLPNDYTREMLLGLLDSQGFMKGYNFVYMPIDFHRKAGLGYAFVNMVLHEDAERIHEKLMGFDAWETPSAKVLDVCWSEPSQGLEAHIERYRNSPVMHPDVAERFKPLLFQDGVSMEFPGPTKRIRPPRLKHGNHRL